MSSDANTTRTPPGDTSPLRGLLTRALVLGCAAAQVDEQILDPDGLECFDRFQESLRLVQRVIESRNDKREVGYLFMMPSLVSCGLVH